MRTHRHGLAMIIRGTVPRLGVHAGFMTMWRKAGLPRPDMIVGTSAGGIIAMAIAGWSDEADERCRRVVGNLRQEDIAVLEPKVAISFRLFVAAALFTLVMFWVQRIYTFWPAFAIITVALAVMLGSGYFFVGSVKDMFFFGKDRKIKAPYNTKPLHDLLLREVDVRALLRSPIEVNILATDVMRSELTVFNTHDGKYTDPDDPAVAEHWVKVALATSALILFPKIKIDGTILADAEDWTDLPIKMVEKYRHVVVVDYWEGSGLRPIASLDSFMESVFREYDILRDRSNANELALYELRRKYESPHLPELHFVRASEDLMQRAPRIHLSNLTPKRLQEAIAFGEAVFEEQLPKIRTYLGIRT